MDDEVLKRQLFDEIHTQFETRLRDAKKQKSQVEEELEAVSERWRMERRRLNAEIDRLESELTEAKSARRKEPNSESQTIDPLEVARIQAAADDRVKQAESAWESERAKLRNEISRLQNAVAEIIERSNNPMRDAVKEQLQNRIDDAFKARQQIEEEFSRAKVLWAEEKLKMTAEILELGQTPSSGAPLKARLGEEAGRGRAHADKEHAQERQEFKAKLEEAAGGLERSKAEILQLQHELLETKDAMSASTKALEARLGAASREREAADGEHSRQRQLLNAQLEESAARLERSKTEILHLQHQLAEMKDAMSGNASELDARLLAAISERETADGEHSQQRQLLNAQLEEGAAQLARSKTEILQLQHQLAEMKDAMSGNASELDARLMAAISERETAQGEHSLQRQLLNAQLEEGAAQLERSSAEILHLQHQLAEMKDAMSGNASELDARLMAAISERETAQGEHSLQRQLLSAQLEEGAAQLERSSAEILHLQHQLAEMKDAMSGNASELDARLMAAIAERETADGEHSQQRQLLNAQLEEGAAQLERSSAEILHLQHQLAEMKDAMSGNASELDARLMAAISERETAQGEHSQQRQLLSAQLEEGAAQLERSSAEVLHLQHQLAEMKDAMTGNASELDARLMAAISERETAQGEHSLQRQLLSAQLEEGAAQLERNKTEILHLQDQLAEMKDAMTGNASELDARLLAAITERETAQGEHSQQRQLLSAQLEEGAAQLERSSAEILHLQHQLAEMKDAMTGNASELDVRLLAAITERETAEGEHTQEQQMLNARLEEDAGLLAQSRAEILELQTQLAKTKDAVSAVAGTPTNTEAIDAEVARVELMIAEIGILIDDPNTELSIVMRKNVERATLDAYLRGILHSTGRNKDS